jgi:uncharacterized membrane protein
MEKATFGLDENVASALTYVLGWLTGIIFLLMEKENKTVKFHAMQSTITFLGLTIVIIVLGWIPFIGMIVLLIDLIAVILWIVLIIKAYQGEKFKLPVIGDLAEAQVK